MENEKGHSEVPRVKNVLFWKWSFVMLNFYIPHKNLLFSKDVLSFPGPALFPQRTSWKSIIILSLSKHFLEMSTCNKHLCSGKHSRKSSRWLRDAEETLRAIRAMLFPPRKLWEGSSWETLNDLPFTPAI